MGIELNNQRIVGPGAKFVVQRQHTKMVARYPKQVESSWRVSFE